MVASVSINSVQFSSYVCMYMASGEYVADISVADECNTPKRMKYLDYLFCFNSSCIFFAEC